VKNTATPHPRQLAELAPRTGSASLLLTETPEENIRRQMRHHEATASENPTNAEAKNWHAEYDRLTALLNDKAMPDGGSAA
jgi:hypothetical protein